MQQNYQPRISPREQTIIRLLANGNSRKMIAAELDIELGTVCGYCRSAYKKLEVNSAIQAINKYNTMAVQV